MTDFADGDYHRVMGSTGTCYIGDAVRSVRLEPKPDHFTFEVPPPVKDWGCWIDTDVKEVMDGLHLHEEDSYTKFAFHRECNIPILDITQCNDGSYGVWLYPPFSRTSPVMWWKMMNPVEVEADKNFFVYKDCDFKKALEKAVRDYLTTYGEAFIQQQRKYVRHGMDLDVSRKSLRTAGESLKDEVENRTPPSDSQAHYPSGLGYRSVLLLEMIQADKDGNEPLALKRLAELETLQSYDTTPSLWMKFIHFLTFLP